MNNLLNEWFDDVFFEINMLLNIHDTVLVAIDGRSGSGKSRLAELLESEYDCNVFHMDDFFLAHDLRTEERLAEAGGLIDYENFEEDVLDNIIGGLDFRFQKYNCKNNTYEYSETVQQKQLNIIEGVYSMHPNFIDIYNLKIFLTVDKNIQLQRIGNRSGEAMLERYVNEWLPLEEFYFSETDLIDKSDVVIDTSDLWQY